MAGKKKSLSGDTGHFTKSVNGDLGSYIVTVDANPRLLSQSQIVSCVEKVANSIRGLAVRKGWADMAVVNESLATVGSLVISARPEYVPELRNLSGVLSVVPNRKRTVEPPIKPRR